MVDSYVSKVSRRTLVKALPAAAGATALAGCTGDDDNETPAEDDADTGDENGDSSGDQGPFVFLSTSELSTGDPASHAFIQGTQFVLQSYDPLVFVDPEDQSLMPYVATDWETEEGGSRYVFNLRDDIVFHNGDQLTAEDVVYSMDRHLSINEGVTYYWNPILEIGDTETIDETTVAFNLSQSFSAFPETMVRFFIVNKSVVSENEQDGDYGHEYLQNREAGSGPYELVEWDTTNNLMEWEPFDDYWQDWPENRFENPRRNQVGESSTIEQLFAAGDGHMNERFTAPDVLEQYASADNVTLREVESADLYQIVMNTQKPPLDDIHVRRAVAHAYDYQTGVDEIYGGQVGAGPVPFLIEGHNDDIEPLSQDLERAEAELQEAEYTLEEINEFTMEDSYDPSNSSNRRSALLFQNNLQDIGIENYEPVPEQFPALASRLEEIGSAPHFYHIFNPPTIPSIYDFTNAFYLPASFGTTNGGHYFSTDRIQELLNGAVSAGSKEEALDMWKEAQEEIVAGRPAIYMANLPHRRAINDNVEGWSFRTPQSYSVYFHDMSWA